MLEKSWRCTTEIESSFKRNVSAVYLVVTRQVAAGRACVDLSESLEEA
jgi:hypothetical protein